MGASGPLWCAREICALVLGPPRAGKTTTIIIPNVLLARGGVVSVSTKSDVFDATFDARRAVGRCYVFDPTNALDLSRDVTRAGWSPLNHARAWERAVLSAESMIGAGGANRSGDSSHWYERAGALLASLFHAAAIGGLPMTVVMRWVNRRDGSEAVELLASRDAGTALDLLVGIVETDAREQSGIWSTASGVLAAYRTDAALASAELEPVDWARFLEGTDTLYVFAPSDHQAHVAPLIAGLIRDLRSFSYARHAGRGGAAGGNVLLVLDELANIAPLHDLPALIAEGASQGVVTLASLQDLSQARARWGVAAEGFFSLFGTKVVLGGIGDRTTLGQLSALAGDHYLNTVSHASQRHLGRWRVRSSSHSALRAPRLPPSAIAAPPPGRALVVTGATTRWTTLVPYFGASPVPSTRPEAAPPVTG